MADLRKYLIVDFPDGSHVIPKKWIKTNTDGETTCFFPSVKCEKTFCKMSKNMITPDKKHWGICQIIKIAGSSDSYDRAVEKLKDLVSYNLSEVCTDKEEFYKSQRKLRAKKKIFSSEDDLSDSASTFHSKITKIKKKNDGKNICTFPTPPKSSSTNISQNYKIKTMTTLRPSNSKNLGNHDKSLKFDYKHDKLNINTVQKSIGNESPLLFESDSDATNISTPQKIQTVINEKPEIIGEGISVESSSKTSCFPSQSYDRELINSEYTSLRVPNNTELIVKEILKGQTIILQKLDQIMESQISITMEHTNSSNNILSTDNLFSKKFKDMFPMTNNNEILKVENSLNDHDFYQYVAQRLQFTGGMCLQQFVTRVMDTLFSGSIFVALNFSGRKKKRGDPEKLGFSKLTLYRLICHDVCFKKFPHTNQDKIDFHLKSWIRHSKERFERGINTVMPCNSFTNG